jgi:hemoglobin
MDLEPGYRELRASHGTTLDDARQKLFWFLCGWLGGPQHYTGPLRPPAPAHAPHAVQDRHLERDQWLACMDQAMGETGVPQELRQRLNQSFFQTADWMRNGKEPCSGKSARLCLRRAGVRGFEIHLPVSQSRVPVL